MPQGRFRILRAQPTFQRHPLGCIVGNCGGRPFWGKLHKFGDLPFSKLQEKGALNVEIKSKPQIDLNVVEGLSHITSHII